MLYAGGGILVLLLGFLGLRKKKTSVDEEVTHHFDQTPDLEQNNDGSQDDELIQDDEDNSFDSYLADEEEEVDPIIACNKLLDSGELGQAESLIGKARKNEPNNVAYTQKLFEVLYMSSNAVGFEKLANSQKEIQHSNPEVWEAVEGMGKELCPTSVLFMGTGAEEKPSIGNEPKDDDVEFDFNFDAVKQSSADSNPDAENTTPLNELEAEVPEIVFDEPEVEVSTEEPDAISDEPKTLVNDGEEAQENEELAAIDFDISTTSDDDSQGDSTPSADTYTDSSMKDVSTKIALAQIYIDMQDDDAARETLEDVLSHGNKEQKAEAQSMLKNL
jgi:pilus assembly protein FimV